MRKKEEEKDNTDCLAGLILTMVLLVVLPPLGWFTGFFTFWVWVRRIYE